MISAMAILEIGQGPTQSDARIAPAFAALRAGHPILVIDEARAHGYFMCAADRGDERFVALATDHGRGVLKAAMLPDDLVRLGIPILLGADCHVPVDLVGCERPGVAADRMATLRALVQPGLDRRRLLTPGHVFPTAVGECHSVDDACVSRVMLEAARMAGCAPVAAFCEAVDDHVPERPQGRAERLAALARRLGIEALTVRALLVQRERLEPAVERVVETGMPTAQGPLEAIGFVGVRTGEEYVAFVAGTAAPAVRVHVHRRCQVSDVFGGVGCGCGEHLREALDEVHAVGDGVLVYYGPSATGFCGRERAGGDPAPAWTFTAEIAALLHDLGVHHAEISSNGPLDVADLAALGVVATTRARRAQCAA
jgi:3,4-dihydroxy 2-butanone 4-phosphate synthase/GTP cyclohydrolase II